MKRVGRRWKWDIGGRKTWGRYLILAAVILAAGILVDLVCQRDVLMLAAGERGRFEVPEEACTWEGFTQTEDGWVLSDDMGVLSVELGGRYVSRFGFSYEYDERLSVKWYVWGPGDWGPAIIEDHNGALTQMSVERLDRPVERLQIVWGRDEMTPEAEEPVNEAETLTFRLREAFWVNSFGIRWQRVFFVWTVLGLAAFLWLGRHFVARHLEAGFLALALGLGILMIVLLPANKASWDEEVHFFHAYCVSHFGLEVKTNDMLERLFVADKENYPYSLPDNLDERRAMNATLNQSMEEEMVYSRGHALAGIYTPAYVPAALGLRLGFLLGLPFTLVYQLGRLFNLLFCAGIFAWAIRKIPIGKAVLCAIGLLPTPLFLMSMYSYDAFLTSLLALGFAWFLDEYLHPQRKIEWYGFAVIALSISIGSMPKAIYVPLILAVFLLPREKFADRRQELWMKGLAAVLFLALMASFVLPTVLSPAESNDTRGGNTSEAGQIPYILSDIPRFLRMLISSICVTFPSYTIGSSVYGTMGHVALEMLGRVISAFMLLVLFADGKRLGGTKDREGRLRGGARAWILLLCAGIIAMVWVAMYLAFTPVGENTIKGVQARYYIPLLLPLYLCLCPDTVKINIKQERLYLLTLTGAALITGAVVTQSMLGLCG